jgi:hypothetical protein
MQTSHCLASRSDKAILTQTTDKAFPAEHYCLGLAFADDASSGAEVVSVFD